MTAIERFFTSLIEVVIEFVNSLKLNLSKGIIQYERCSTTEINKFIFQILIRLPNDY